MKMIIFGPIGSGKGTYASKLSQIFGVPHISTGDIFREIVKSDSELGKEVKRIMDAGGLQPDEITIELVKERLSKSDAKKGFILDGYPRNMEQLKGLEKITDIDVAVLLNVSEWILLKRLTNRVVCRKCNEIFNILTLPPKKEGICDKCGGELYHRHDDMEDAIKKRLEIFNKETEPLVKYYREKGLLKEITCDKLDSPPEENVEKILKAIGVKK